MPLVARVFYLTGVLLVLLELHSVQVLYTEFTKWIHKSQINMEIMSVFTVVDALGARVAPCNFLLAPVHSISLVYWL